MKKILMIAAAAGFVATSALAQATIAVPETEAEYVPSFDVVVTSQQDDAVFVGSDIATTPTFPSVNRNRSQMQNMEDGWTYNGWNKK